MSESDQGHFFRRLRSLRRSLALSLLATMVTLTCTTGFAAEPATRNNDSNGSNDGGATTLEIGIHPYLSARAVLTTYHPLQQYLQAQLRRPVLFVTAPDFRTFVERTQQGEYRFVLTAPHFARLAQQEAGYLPMLRTKRDLQGLLVVTQDSPLHHISELRGKTVATPDSLAIISMLGARLLRASGLKPSKDVTLRATSSHDTAVLSLQKGDSAAAIVSVTALQQMPRELKMGVRTLATSSAAPHIMFLAHPKTPRRELADMTRLLLEFAENVPEGKKFMGDTGYLGLRPPTTKEMEELDPYVNDLKNLLGKH